MPWSNRVVPRQLDIASRLESDGTCSLIFYTIFHIHYVPRYHGGADKNDLPQCEKIRRENDLVVSFDNVLETKQFFEYICETGSRAWELQTWLVGKFTSPSDTCFSLCHRSICDVPYRMPGFRCRIGKDGTDYEAEVSMWKEHTSPVASHGSSTTIVAGSSCAKYRVLIRWKNSTIENKWLTGSVTPAALFSMPEENVTRGNLLDTGNMSAVHSLGTQKVKISPPKEKTVIYSGKSCQEYVCTLET